MGKITQLPSYRCTDQTTFTDLREAKRHEASLDLMRIFMEEGFHNDGALKRFCIAFADNFDKIKPVLKQLARLKKS